MFRRWLAHLTKVLENEAIGNEMISWAVYHASQQLSLPEISDLALISLLPPFFDQAKSVAMIRHSKDIMKTAVGILNQGQVPVIACDQPLYTLAK